MHKSSYGSAYVVTHETDGQHMKCQRKLSYGCSVSPPCVIMLGWRQSADHDVHITRCTENKDYMGFEWKQNPVRMISHNVVMQLMTGGHNQLMIIL